MSGPQRKLARWKVAGWGAAGLMLATIAAISLSGEWPNDAPIERPEIRGLLALPAAQVVRVEVTEGSRHGEFLRAPSGGWQLNGSAADAAVAGHVDTALRFLATSAPDRVFGAGEYDPRKMEDFGLDPPRAQVNLVALDGSMTGVAFGDASPTRISQYVAVAGRPELYLLSRFVGAEWQLALDMAGRASGGTRLSPVSIERIWAVELVSGGRLIRFERDASGSWFHHVGEHVHANGGLMHRADPAMAPLIAAELGGLDQTPVQSVVAQMPDETALSGFGLDHPSSIVLLYSRDSSRAVARIEVGGPAKDGLGVYARVQGGDTVMAIPGSAVAHLGRLVELAGNAS